jgi:predicted dehydrogenase
MDKLRVGVIGTGMIGKQHLKTYADLPDAEVVAVADIRQDEADKVAAEHGIAKVFTDYHDLLALPEIDAVDVCLHNALHCPVTLEAFAAGKHVYCEKPLALTSDEARQMVSAADAAGKQLAMQLNTIFAKPHRAAKHLIDEGHLGRLYYARSSHYRRRGRPYVDGYGTPPFVQKENSGGGALVDMAVYHIGLMLHLLGNPDPISVSGSTFQLLDMDEKRRAESGYNVEELGVGLVRLAGGATLFIEEAWAIHGDPGPKHSLYGDRGGLSLDPLTYHTNLAGMDGDMTFMVDAWDWRELQLRPETAGYASSQAHWVAGLLGKVPLIDTGRIGLKIVMIVEALFKSAQTGQEVRLDRG